MKLKIDTGAKCNIITLDTWNKLPNKQKKNKSSRTLKSFSNHIIKLVGMTNLAVAYKGNKHKLEFEIVDLQQENILSGNAAERIGIIQRVDSVSNKPEPIPNELSKDHKLSHEFPELVKTTGTLPGEYSIDIDESVPGVVHSARKLPAAIKPKAIKTLCEMEENKYITRVDEPLKWVSSMVVSLQKDKVRICLDPKDLNKAVKRAHHPMKTIQEVVQNIPGAKIFSVLDAKSGFMQIKLDKKSSYLTTFNTPIARYRW